jgi:hypothetical protein
MPEKQWTYHTAMAAAQDEACRKMRREGRQTWNQDDYNLAARTFNRIFPLAEAVAESLKRQP